ncbi:MAG TPA: inorganic phosphate transporter [Magnetospirillaceae bacterium]|nr:inorganic phosphate transporter [Magnetospirillaceae bacterium]
MDALFAGDMSVPTMILLFSALALALGFEFVNGFHDTANAVATVIYTRSLPPTAAVILSGTCNFIGVSLSTGAVAFGIIALLPVELILDIGSGPGFAMVFSLLFSAIIWNLGTWYLGLPASSSHTLIGSIVGVGLMNSYLSAHAFGDGINWGKVQDTGLALLISPLVGFFAAGLLLLVSKVLIKNPALFEEPPKEGRPPLPVRILLWFTCAGVSFAHGSNDGQKGMGLIMLVLIGIVPAGYALDLSADGSRIAALQQGAGAAATWFQAKAGEDATMDSDQAKITLSDYLRSGHLEQTVYVAAAMKSKELNDELSAIKSFADLAPDQRSVTRRDAFLIAETVNKLNKTGQLPKGDDTKPLLQLAGNLKMVTSFIPTWVKFAVAIALGLGTTVGWKRIVVTVGEKIGKAHLTYAQGACAELVAAACIGAADQFGLPVSTTHVLSSGVAGTMAANRSGLQADTLRNVLLAWVLTLPVCVLLGATLFGASLFLLLRVFGIH